MPYSQAVKNRTLFVPFLLNKVLRMTCPAGNLAIVTCRENHPPKLHFVKPWIRIEPGWVQVLNILSCL
jgi:hypothetical protein